MSVCPSMLSHLNRFSTSAEWSILVLGFAKYFKRSSETQVSYTLKKHHRVFISRSVQNGWAFKLVDVSTGCAIAVDHTLNYRPGSRGDNTFGSIRPSVCPSIRPSVRPFQPGASGSILVLTTY